MAQNHQKTVIRTSYNTVFATLAVLSLLVGLSWLDTQAHTQADNAHAFYCDTFREACDPFYQQ